MEILNELFHVERTRNKMDSRLIVTSRIPNIIYLMSYICVTKQNKNTNENQAKVPIQKKNFKK